MVALEEQGLLGREKTTANPLSGQRLTGPRVIYTNKFLRRDDLKDALDAEDFADATAEAAAVEIEDEPFVD